MIMMMRLSMAIMTMDDDDCDDHDNVYLERCETLKEPRLEAGDLVPIQHPAII